MSKKMAIIASKGTLDGAYPPFLLASTAAALGIDVKIFFTFYGLTLLTENPDLRVSPLGNPAMPMPVTIPTLLQTLPGIEKFATWMMKRKIKSKNIMGFEALRNTCIEAEVELIACQMTLDLFDYKEADLIPQISRGGAATFLEFASDADISLYI